VTCLNQRRRHLSNFCGVYWLCQTAVLGHACSVGFKPAGSKRSEGDELPARTLLSMVDPVCCCIFYSSVSSSVTRSSVWSVELLTCPQRYRHHILLYGTMALAGTWERPAGCPCGPERVVCNSQLITGVSRTRA